MLNQATRVPPIIAIAPVGDALMEDVLLELRLALASAFGAEVIAVRGILLPSSAYDGDRRQYHSTPILQQLARVKPRHAERLLGVADVDLYVPGLNFVFGEADTHRGVAVFSLARSDQSARALFLKRAATEALHELGHTYRLDHCANPHCVMWFSNTLAETDRKGTGDVSGPRSAFSSAHSGRPAALTESVVASGAR